MVAWARGARRVVDLGCGPGNSTEVLAAHLPAATEVVGIDSSPEMLRQARESYPNWRWEEADVAAWAQDAAVAAAPYDVVFTNATLHWLPDHANLLPALWRTVAPGGVLAVQMPRNFDAPSHTVLEAVARAGPWASKLRGAREQSYAHPPGFSYDVLAPLAAELAIWETEYTQVMGSAADIVEWVRGTALRPFLGRLDAEEQAAFVRDYTLRVAEAYPPRADGRVLFPFKRIFVMARKN